jgi:methionyl-tRNA formyltransferase
LFPMGVEALVESVDRVRDGTAEKIPQDSDAGTYEGWCRKENVEVDWAQPADTVYNLIRGANPQPGAWTTYDDRELGILDCRKVDAKGAPGEVVAVHNDSLVIATASGGLQIDRLRVPEFGKIDAGEFAARTELAPGSVFGRQVK